MEWYEPMSVADHKVFAERTAKKLAKSLGRPLEGIQSSKQSVAESFWGKAWCKHLKSYADYDHRLSRGRSYLKNALVLDLQLLPGRVEAYVCGTELYELSIDFKALDLERWNAFKKVCAGKVNSMIDLLSAKLSDEVIVAMLDVDSGLFPNSRELVISCNCLDHARFCKHVSAVLYGVAIRFDKNPELFFALRQVDVSELFEENRKALDIESGDFSDADLGSLFGIELVDPDQDAKKVDS